MYPHLSTAVVQHVQHVCRLPSEDQPAHCNNSNQDKSPNKEYLIAVGKCY